MKTIEDINGEAARLEVETRKLRAENDKFTAETIRFYAEAAMRRDRWWGYLALSAALTAIFGAGMAAGIGLSKLCGLV